MPTPRRSRLGLVLAGLAALAAVRVIGATVGLYGVYFPPDFARSEFLLGREAQFLGPYRWAFAAHVVAGPVALGLGLILAATGASGRGMRWHRRLGWAQAGCVLGVVFPSGLVMARYAAAGPVAAAGLVGLAVATAGSCAAGIRAAVVGDLAGHRRWMGRTLALLASAVVLRALGGLGSVLGVAAPWYDPVAVWASWVLPLAGFEAWCVTAGRGSARPRRSSAALRGRTPGSSA